MARWLFPVLLMGAATLVPVALPAGGLLDAAASAQGSRDGEINLQRPDGKPGIYASRLDAKRYEVAAYNQSMKGDPDERLAELARMVLVRSALLALENGRQYFAIEGDMATDIVGARIQNRAGTAGQQMPQQCGRGPSGLAYCYPGEFVEGTPPSSLRFPGYFGRKATVHIYRWFEGKAIEEGRSTTPGNAFLFPAEQYYTEFRNKTPGKWPTTVSVYEDRVARYERMMGRSAEGRLNTDIVIYSLYRLGGLYEQSGKTRDAARVRARADQLLEAS